MAFKFRNRIKEVMITVAIAAGLLWAATLPGELGLDEDQTRQDLLQAVASGYVPVYKVSNVIKAATPALRATLIQGVLEWAKSYSESPEFAAAYSTARNENMPLAPEPRGSVEEEIERERAKAQQEIEEMRTIMADLPADQQPAMEETFKTMIASIEQMYSDPEMRKLQAQMIEAQRAEEQQQYETALQEWKENYPENPRLLIARRLQEFLKVSADVNFNAQLEEVDKKMLFVEEQYEQKPPEWKLCFRAGEETVVAARAFASTWLTTLPQN